MRAGRRKSAEKEGGKFGAAGAATVVRAGVALGGMATREQEGWKARSSPGGSIRGGVEGSFRLNTVCGRPLPQKGHGGGMS